MSDPRCPAPDPAVHTAAAPAGGTAVIPGAVPTPLTGLLAGPLLAATVHGVHRAAVILRVDIHDVSPGGRHPRVVSVLTTEASGVPHGVRTTLSVADAPFAHLRPGDPAFVGAGRIDLPGLRIRGVRTVRTAVPRVAPGAAAVAQIAAAAHAADRGVDDAPVDEFRAALAAGDPARLRAAVRDLVGRGTGSTPGGDDVLAGTMAALLATRREVLAGQIAAAALPDLDRRTPLLSADLLRLAAAGHVCLEASALLRASDRGAATAIRHTLSALIAIGHTSGADLATGLSLGLAVPGQPPPRRARRRPAVASRPCTTPEPPSPLTTDASQGAR